MGDPSVPRVLRFGQAVPRYEDARFLTGRGRYVSDLAFPDAAVAKVFRSPHAAGRIKHLDVTAAQQAPGVLAVLTAADAKADDLGVMRAFMQRNKADGSPGFQPEYRILPDAAVHHVGEALAFIVAEDEASAAAALELVDLEVETAPAVTGINAALALDAPAVWAEEPGNICFVEPVGRSDGIDDAFAGAAHVVEREYGISRIIAAPMETRSAVGEFDAATGRYTLHTGTQAPHLMRNEIAQNVLGVAPENLRILSPDIGGGFGLKVSAQREMALVLWAARRIGRPVRWVSERADAFLGDHHARDNFARVALALDSAGRFLGLRLKLYCAMGAYVDTFALHIMVNNVGGVAGPYRIGAFDVEVSGVFTNTQPVGPYRGAGRPEATYCIERIIDDAARELGLDPVDLRRRNMVPPTAMP